MDFLISYLIKGVYSNICVLIIFSQGGSEVLQCPRCNASVPANPGVCAACGENAHQCQKCRTINYDERDPFLCISCGFSKYARFETSVEGRSCSAVDPIESEEDRQKVCINLISSSFYLFVIFRHYSV